VGNYQSGGQRFADKLDDVRIYGRALTALEISALGGNGQNRAPLAQDDLYALTEDTVLSVAAPGVLGNDIDPEFTSVTAAKLSSPLHGVASLSANGSLTYTPASNYFGIDSFTYAASDGTLAATATVTIAVYADTDGDGVANLYDPDDDNDGIPDTWEDLYGLGSTVSNGMADADGDGVCNFFEYVAGTVPTNAKSVFQITAISNRVNYAVYFLTVTNRLYGADWRTDLFSPDWTELTSGIPGNGLVRSAIDTNLAAPCRFYRIRVNLP
jgi:hypothetical protein